MGPGLAALAQLSPDAAPAQRVAALNQTTLKFHAGSSELTGDSRQTLEAAANALRDTPAGTRVEIGAHTDSRGQAEANLHLSQQRAEAVSQGLQALGWSLTRWSPWATVRNIPWPTTAATAAARRTAVSITGCSTEPADAAGLKHLLL